MTAADALDAKLTEYLKPRELFSIDNGRATVVFDCFKYLTPAFNRRRAQLRRGQQQQQQQQQQHQQQQQQQKKQDEQLTTSFFLGHAHSDHYGGLVDSFNEGSIFCSKVTAAVLRLQFPNVAFTTLDANKRYRLDIRAGRLVAGDLEAEKQQQQQQHEVDFDMIDANHCPGASIFVFYSPIRGIVVHTSDFRYNGVSSSRGGGTVSTAPAKPVLALKQAPPKPQAKRIGAGLGVSNHLSGRSPIHAQPASSSSPSSSSPSSSSKTTASSSSGGGGGGDDDALRAALPTAWPLSDNYGSRVGDSGILQHIRGKVSALYLDNTFCDPAYNFPPQADALQSACVAVVKRMALAAESLVNETNMARIAAQAHAQPEPPKRRVRVALCVGAYSIGKERVAIALHRTLGVRFVVGKSRADLLRACRMEVRPRGATYTEFDSAAHSKAPGTNDGDDDDAPLADLLLGRRDAVVVDPAKVETVLDPETSPIWKLVSTATLKGAAGIECTAVSAFVVDMGKFSYPNVANAYADAALAVARLHTAATGEQSAEAAAPPPQVVTSVPFAVADEFCIDLRDYDAVIALHPTGWAAHGRQSRDNQVRNVSLLTVPYSEHCAFRELVDFVALLAPEHVIPTVAVDAYAKQEHCFARVCRRLKIEYGNVQPLNRFLTADNKTTNSPVAEVVDVDESSSGDDDVTFVGTGSASRDRRRQRDTRAEVIVDSDDEDEAVLILTGGDDRD